MMITAAAQKSSHTTTTKDHLPAITFHPVHGENIQLSANGTVATRVSSFCKGICFSQRPIKINERVTIRFLEMSSLWSGLLRFGFTTRDPATFRSHQSLPKYACPDLTNNGHTHAKALPEVFAQQGNVLFFYVSSSGNVHYGVNGEEKGVILTNVRVNGPIWAVIDVYGNTVKIEAVATQLAPPVLNNNRNSTSNLQLLASRSMGDLSHELLREPSPQIYSNKSLNKVRLHRSRGRNIRLSADRTIAERDNDSYANGYVFTKKPMAIGEKLVIQVLKTTNLFTGSLAFGLTTADPDGLDVYELPDNSHDLLDRPEYWVAIKDVANRPQAGDEITFCITPRGEVQMTKNRQAPITLMHIDISQPLWGFFDIYGNTLKVRMLGSQLPLPAVSNSQRAAKRGLKNPLSVSMFDVQNMLANFEADKMSKQRREQQPRPQPKMKPTPSKNYYNTMYSHAETKSTNNLQAANNSTGGGAGPLGGSECIICYDRPVNSVLYSCGHMFMCHHCAVKQAQTSGLCPMCRAPIRDVIRTYWA